MGGISQALIANAHQFADLLLGVWLIGMSRELSKMKDPPTALVSVGYLNAGASIVVALSGTYGILGGLSSTVSYILWAIELPWALLLAQWLKKREVMTT